MTKSYSRGRSLAIGLACAAIALLWQFLTVHANYQSKWNALFSTGTEAKVPPALASENIYLFAGTTGYDGEMYHYIAHDPFFHRGFAAYLDAPRMRYRRILIPLAAHVLALGRDDLIDRAYMGVILIAIFCGGFWLSAYCSTLGLSAGYGLAFLLIPATLVSIDRLTVDAGLAALCIAFVLFAARGSLAALYGMLIAATLVRETGFLLLLGFAAWLVFHRELKRAALFLTSALPALAWYLFVQLKTEPGAFSAFSLLPFQGLVERLASPYAYPFAVWINVVSTFLDYAALAGILVAVALAVRMAARREWTPLDACIYLFALLALFLNAPGAWRDVYAFGRTLSPLLVLLALKGLAHRQWVLLLPLLLVIPRVAIQFEPQVYGVLRYII